MSVTGRSRELIQKYLEGIADGAELAELEALLATEPEIADSFVESVRLDSALGDFFRRQYKMDQVAALLRDPAANASTPLVAGQGSESTAEKIDQPGQPASSPRLSGSVFVPRDTRPVAARRNEFAARPSVSRRFLQRKWLMAMLLLLGLGVAWWSWRTTGSQRWRLVSGRVSVSDQAATEVPMNAPFEVVGPEVAVIERSDGVRLELMPTTRATLRHNARQSVLELVSGGGDFQITENSASLRIESTVGAIVAQKGRLSLSFIPTAPPAHFSPAIPERYPRLIVTVADGVVSFHQGATTKTLSPGEPYVFFSQA